MLLFPFLAAQKGNREGVLDPSRILQTCITVGVLSISIILALPYIVTLQQVY